MNTILKIVGYESTSLSETALRVASSSNLKGNNMTLDEFKNYLEIRISEYPTTYANTKLGIVDDKLFVMQDGKKASFIVERTKL